MNNQHNSYKLILSFSFFTMGGICLLFAFILSYLSIGNGIIFALIGFVLCLWASIVFPSTKITANDIRNVISAANIFRKRLD